MSKLTPIARRIEELLFNEPTGFSLEAIFNKLKLTTNYIEKKQIERNLRKYVDTFILDNDGNWQLKYFQDQDKKESKILSKMNESTDNNNAFKTKGSENASFAETRNEYVNNLMKDLIGPSQEDEELEEKPNYFYLGGMLYPSNVPVENFEKGLEFPNGNLLEPSEEDGDDVEESGNHNRFQPSSIGLSCNIKSGTDLINIRIEYGKYEENKSGKKRTYKRQKASHLETIFLVDKKGSLFFEEQTVECRWFTQQKNDRITLSIFLINRHKNTDKEPLIEEIIFQPVLSIEVNERYPGCFLPRQTEFINMVDDPDLKSANLLYRNKLDFAVGHSCAAKWNNEDRPTQIMSTFIPDYEVPAVDHLELPNLKGLEMDVLAYVNSKEQLREHLMPLVELFDNWIDEQNEIDLEPKFMDQREKHISSCREASQRIKSGIDILCDPDDDMPFEAFKFANEIMLYQRSFTLEAGNYRKTGIHRKSLNLEGRWRPFQLAFILLNIKGITNPECSKERNLVDLLWFPTGGGKTEAYLGLSSFVMALRRLKGVSGGVSQYAGTTILMRYTLRLLTIQQFQRATALICAAEYFRSKNRKKWGSESFSIGLWVGGDTTPNQLSGTDDSAKAVLEELRQKKRVRKGNPVQLHNCPRCGEELTPESYNIDNDVFTIYCPYDMCYFNENPIPAYTVDEAIYYKCPTILIGTVDKMARLPWNGKIATLFGRVDRYCERHGFIREGDQHPNNHTAKGKLKKSKTIAIDNLIPPELIIQDELHLISGPLGSMTGLYETAVDYLSTYNRSGKQILPKIIASTATIRRADQQIKGVFHRDFRQFPPAAINSEDTFFSKEVPNTIKPGRKYIGLCFPGSSVKTSLVRIYASLLQKGFDLKLEGKEVDPYWTLAGYFNSLRELGGTLRLVEDDIPDRIKYIVKDKSKRRFLNYIEELTSRIDATDIPVILNKLEQPAKNKKAVDVLLATNMISVGVDIDRLGLMVVTGQPKGTSEYIQATSRVGRKYPGLVFTLYNWSRPRDISHYEQFITYHSKFYSHVEATSVTPFSYRSRDKGLPAVIIGLLRQLDSELFRNKDARNFSSTNRYLKEVKEFIINRCKDIDNIDGSTVENEIDAIVSWWLERIHDDPDSLEYQHFQFSNKETPVLIRNINQSVKDAELVPDSLRDVEAEVDVFYTYYNREGGEE